MSVDGTARIQPDGSFYGSVAGESEVRLQPGCTLELIDPPESGVNWPGAGGTTVNLWIVDSYAID